MVEDKVQWSQNYNPSLISSCNSQEIGTTMAKSICILLKLWKSKHGEIVNQKSIWIFAPLYCKEAVAGAFELVKDQGYCEGSRGYFQKKNVSGQHIDTANCNKWLNIYLHFGSIKFLLETKYFFQSIKDKFCFSTCLWSALSFLVIPHDEGSSFIS